MGLAQSKAEPQKLPPAPAQDSGRQIKIQHLNLTKMSVYKPGADCQQHESVSVEGYPENIFTKCSAACSLICAFSEPNSVDEMSLVSNVIALERVVRDGPHTRK